MIKSTIFNIALAVILSSCGSSSILVTSSVKTKVIPGVKTASPKYDYLVNLDVQSVPFKVDSVVLSDSENRIMCKYELSDSDAGNQDSANNRVLTFSVSGSQVQDFVTQDAEKLTVYWSKENKQKSIEITEFEKKETRIR